MGDTKHSAKDQASEANNKGDANAGKSTKPSNIGKEAAAAYQPDALKAVKNNKFVESKQSAVVPNVSLTDSQASKEKQTGPFDYLKDLFSNKEPERKPYQFAPPSRGGLIQLMFKQPLEQAQLRLQDAIQKYSETQNVEKVLPKGSDQTAEAQPKTGTDYANRAIERIKHLNDAGAQTNIADSARHAIETDITMAMQLEPNNARTQARACQASASLSMYSGDFSAAINDLQRAKNLDPTDVRSYSKLASAYASTGDTTTALDYLNRAAAIYREQGKQQIADGIINTASMVTKSVEQMAPSSRTDQVIVKLVHQLDQ